MQDFTSKRVFLHSGITAFTQVNDLNTSSTIGPNACSHKLYNYNKQYKRAGKTRGLWIVGKNHIRYKHKQHIALIICHVGQGAHRVAELMASCYLASS